MQLVVTVKEMKNYLRVDFDDDDVLLSDLIEQGQQICMDVARIRMRMSLKTCRGRRLPCSMRLPICMNTGRKRIIISW